MLSTLPTVTGALEGNSQDGGGKSPEQGGLLLREQAVERPARGPGGATLDQMCSGNEQRRGLGRGLCPAKFSWDPKTVGFTVGVVETHLSFTL